MPRAVAARPVSDDRFFAQTVEVLAGLRPGYPKFFSMADLSTQSRRRWVPLDSAVRGGRVDLMYNNFLAESQDRRYAVSQVACAFTHGVVGRSAAAFVATGRVWDTGAENLAVRTDIDGGLDWAGVRDTTLRVLPTEGLEHGVRAGLQLPCDESMARWLACRSRGTLEPILGRIARLGGVHPQQLWSVVGQSVLGVATLVPNFSAVSPELGHERGQMLLQAFHDMGLAVRSRSALPRTRGAGPIPVRERRSRFDREI